jgi:hypothetical protein
MPSTVIRRFSYDDETDTLFVTFIDGDVYAYRHVPREVCLAFQRAFSKGRFFSERIRGLYAYVKLPAGGTYGQAGRSISTGPAQRGRSSQERTPP